MPPGLPGVPVPGSLKGEPGLFAALPGVVSPRSWQDWLGGPGGPGGLSARAGLASPSEKKAMIRATNTHLRTTLLLLGGDAPDRQCGFRGEGYTTPLTLRNMAQFGSVPGEVSVRLAGNRACCDRDVRVPRGR